MAAKNLLSQNVLVWWLWSAGAADCRFPDCGEPCYLSGNGVELGNLIYSVFCRGSFQKYSPGLAN